MIPIRSFLLLYIDDTWSVSYTTLLLYIYDTWSVSYTTFPRLVLRRGVDDDGAVAAPDEAEVPPRRQRAPACLRAGYWLPACLVATHLLACMVLYACSVCLPGGACLVVDCWARATRRMQAAVAWIRTATKRFAWKKKKSAEKKRQMGPAFDFLEVKY